MSLRADRVDFRIVAMDKLREYLKNKPHIALSAPAVLCFLTFITNLVKAMQDGYIDDAEFHQLLSTADGFETVILFVVMLVLRDKNK